MSIMPEGDAIRKAVQWISEELENQTDQPVAKLISEAGLRFDLKPNEEEYLIRFYSQKPSAAEG